MAGQAALATTEGDIRGALQSFGRFARTEGRPWTTVWHRAVVAGAVLPGVSLSGASYFLSGPDGFDEQRLAWSLGLPLYRTTTRRRGAQVEIEQVPTLAAFSTYLRSLGTGERQLLEVILIRGLMPWAAVRTADPAQLFTDTELRVLATATPDRSAVQASTVSFQPGQALDYGSNLYLIVKLTRRCNLRCVYCHDWSVKGPPMMTFELLRQLNEQALSPDRAEITFVWHGGEPTLVGRRGLLRALYLQAHFRRDGQRVTNLLQTNGTTVTPAWTRLLDYFGIRVGLSLDGPPALHDRSRVDASGRGTYAEVVRGLQLLRARGLLGTVLLVVTAEIVEYGAAGLVRALVDLELHNIGLLPVRPGNTELHRLDEAMTRSTYLRFLMDVDAEIRRQRAPLRVRETEAVRAALFGRPAGHCELHGNCVGTFLSVDVDGSLAHCDKYVGDPEYQLGHLMTGDLRDPRSSGAVQRLQQVAMTSTQQRECPYQQACLGWCPHEAYVSRRLGDDLSCCGLAPLFEHFLAAEPEQFTPTGAAAWH